MYDPVLHQRRSIRLKGYDYSQSGAYYVTICVQHRKCLFGSIVSSEMQLNGAGEMVVSIWQSLPTRFANLELDEFVVMPNHFHGILLVTGSADVAGERAPTGRAANLGEIVGAFKSLVTVEYIRGVKNRKWLPFVHSLLQRGYYEHIIQDNTSLEQIRDYIANNPQQWKLDGENPESST